MLAQDKEVPGNWYERYAKLGNNGSAVRYGFDGVSPSSVSFHYLKLDALRRVHTRTVRCLLGGLRAERGEHPCRDYKTPCGPELRRGQTMRPWT